MSVHAHRIQNEAFAAVLLFVTLVTCLLIACVPSGFCYAVEADSADDYMPMTDGGSAEKYLKELKGEDAVKDAKDSQEQVEADALGHWEYGEIETKSTHEEQAAPSNPGTAIAVAATALSGYGRTGGLVGPKSGSQLTRRKTKPPERSSYGDWTVYNRVMDAIPNHAVGRLYTDCSATVALAIWWSGVDDSFSGSNTVAQARYMARSSKWSRVGGKNAYFHRRSGSCDGFELQPGDVLVGKPCVTEGRRTHIFIYTGTEISNMKYPGANYTLFESHMGKSWPGMQGFKPIPNGTVDYAVYRRNNVDLNIEGSRFAGYYLDEKVRFSPETKLVEEKSSETVAVRYVYNEYKVSYVGLPLNASVSNPTTFRYDTPTFKLNAPLLPTGYVFEGWYTGEYIGAELTEIAQGTSSNIVAHAHIHEDEIHSLEYHRDMERPEPKHPDNGMIIGAIAVVAIGAIVAAYVIVSSKRKKVQA